MSPKDRAAILAGLVLDTLAESVRDNPELRYRLCNLFRGELNDMRQELIADRHDVDTDHSHQPRAKEADMSMRTGDFYQSRFMKPKDLKGPTPAEVSHMASEPFKDSPEPKPLAYFKGMRKPLILNKTNIQALEDIAGTDLMDNWPGIKCALVPTTILVNGEQKPTIRIEPPSQKELPIRRPIKPAEPDGMDDEIPF